MPRDLFGDVVSRSPGVRSRRAPVVLASILGHVAILIVLVMSTLVAADVLPTPSEALEFFDARDITTIKPPEPPPPPPKAITAPTTPSVNPGAPLVAPPIIAPEQPRELVDLGDRENGVVGGLNPNGPGISALEPAPPPPPPPPPAPDRPVRVGSGIRAPQKIVNVAPVYPTIAQQVHKEGIVIIEATIDVQGNVVAMNVLRSVQLLDDAA